MAKYLCIKKYKTKDNKYSYHVLTNNINDFYICIDTEKKKVTFYKNSDLTLSIGEMALLSAEPFIKIPGIEPEAVVLSIIQAAKALKKNEFPEYISKQV